MRRCFRALNHVLEQVQWTNVLGQRMECSLGTQLRMSCAPLQATVSPRSWNSQLVIHSDTSRNLYTSTILLAKKGGKKDKQSGKVAQDDSALQEDFDMAPFTELMEAAVSHYQSELGKIHTGRASPGLLEPIEVAAHNERLPLKTYGTVTARSATLLVVTVYNEEDLEQVAKAIRTSPLKLQARVEGKEIHVPVPRPSLEQIEGMVRLVSQEGTKAKNSVRSARHKALEKVKAVFKSSDEARRATKEVDKVHEEYLHTVEQLQKSKEKELHETR